MIIVSKPKRKRIALTLDEIVLKYLRDGIQNGKWYNYSHAVERIIKEYMKAEKNV